MNTPDFARFLLLVPVVCEWGCAKPLQSELIDRKRLAYISTSETTSIDQSAAPDIRVHPFPPDPKDHSNLSNPSDPLQNSDGTDNVEVDETPSPPSQIAGSNLRCYLEETANESELVMGCRFQDQGKRRVEVRTIAKKVVFAAPSVLFSGVSRSLKTLKNDPDYDVLFKFTGASGMELQAAVKSARFVVTFYGLNSGEAQRTLALDGRVLLEFSRTSWQRDPERNGECDGIEGCLFESDGLVWAGDTGDPVRYGEAQAVCDTFEEGTRSWRLPTLEEMDQAHTKHIAHLEASSGPHPSRAYYWTAKQDEENVSVFEFWSGDTLVQDETGLGRTVCVRNFD